MTEQQTPREAAALAASGLAQIFGRELDEPAYQLWAVALEDLTVDDIQRAAARAARECKFMPSPAEFRSLITGGADNAEAMAHHAYSCVEQAASRVGGYKSPDFEDPIINATIRHLGGWVRITELPESEFDVWFRKDFMATYKTFYAHPPSPEACAPLIGLHYQANGTYHDHDQPALISAPVPLPARLQHLRNEVNKNQEFLTNRPANLPKPQLKRIGTDGEVITD